MENRTEEKFIENTKSLRCFVISSFLMLVVWVLTITYFLT
jgi:hypothetical protein